MHAFLSTGEIILALCCILNFITCQKQSNIESYLQVISDIIMIMINRCNDKLTILAM